MQMPDWREFIRCVDVGKEDGEEKYSLDDLTLRDVSVRPRIGPTLGENLFLFADAEEIQRVRKMAKIRPDILLAVREEIDEPLPASTTRTQPKGTDKESGPCQCRACKAKKDKEDQ